MKAVQQFFLYAVLRCGIWIAGLVVILDFALPSWLTGPFDELALFAIIALLTWAAKAKRKLT